MLMPPDDVIAAYLGFAPFWAQLAPCLDLLGYLAWYVLGALLMLLAVIAPGPFAAPLMAAFATGVTVKLSDVYSWGRFSYFEQLAVFIGFTLVIALIRLARRRRRDGIVFSDSAV